MDAVHAAVAQASKLTVVDASTLVAVVAAAKELHKVTSQIESSRKAAKRQFLDANKAIDELAAKISRPLENHYRRLTKLLAAWYDAEQQRKEAEEQRKRQEEERLAETLRKESEERERQRQALLEAQANAKTRDELEQAALDLEFMDAEIPVDLDLQAVEIPIQETPHAPIEGARTQTRYRFTLTDPIAAYQYDKRLVNWTLSILTCQDIIRLLNDKGLALQIPGITIESYTDVTTPSGRNGN